MKKRKHNIPLHRSDSHTVQPGCARFPSWWWMRAELPASLLLQPVCQSSVSWALRSSKSARASHRCQCCAGRVHKRAAGQMTNDGTPILPYQPMGAARFDAVDFSIMPHHPPVMTSLCPMRRKRRLESSCGINATQSSCLPTMNSPITLKVAVFPSQFKVYLQWTSLVLLEC